MDFTLPEGRKKATFCGLYSELALHKALLKTYTKPLFAWRKALVVSHDGQTLYDFARHTPKNAIRLHRLLRRQDFHFREGIEVQYNFNRKHRTIYLFPWEERIVDVLLYNMLNRYFHSAFSNHSYAYRHRDFGVDFCQRNIRKSLTRMGNCVYGFKRDIKDYFPSIDHEILIEALKEWVEPDDYLFELLTQRITYKVKTDDGERIAERGVPFGTAIACFFANLYLTPLDNKMNAIKGLSYFRYADDMLVFSPDRDKALEAMEIFDTSLEKLKLQSKPSHHKDFYFSNDNDGKNDDVFEQIEKFRHLGLEFRADGSVGLSRDKFRKIRNLFRFAFRRAKRKFRRLVKPEKRAALAVELSRDVIERGFRSIAIIDYYLKHVDDEDQLCRLDRWLAEEVLAIAFQNGHKKGNFRKMSFKQLRAMGLPSLRHRRRLIMHGHLDSSFFRMRTNKLVDNEIGRRLPGRKAFSPCLEAAANNPCEKEGRL